MQQKHKSVKQVSDLPDGCQQGRFGSTFRCVKDPVREGQACGAGTEKGPWLKQINRLPSSPDVVITAGSENSVPCAWGEIGTGYT